MSQTSLLLLPRSSAALSALLLFLAWACGFPRYSTDDADSGVEAGAAACPAGVCEPTCPLGFADCDQNPENGCETSLAADDSCGACGVACTNDHGLNQCAVMGEAAWGCAPTCMTGFDDCDLRSENGCETSINQDSLSCGRCGNACPSNGGTPVCVAGGCGLSSCNTGFGDCSNAGVCSFNLNTDPLNCARCGHVCSSEHGKARCNAGVCESDCDAGYGDCNRDAGGVEPPNDGCETQLNQPDKGGNVPNCGACGASCQRRAYTTINLAKCAQGVCFRDCFAGAYDCDNQRNDPSCLSSGCACEFKPCN